MPHLPARDPAQLEREAEVAGRRMAGVASPAAKPEHAPAGEPLAPGTRDLYERGLGHDFSKVRIFADDRAASSADAAGAEAYAAGDRLYRSPWCRRA